MTRAFGGRRSPYVIAHDRELVREVLAERARLTDDEFYFASAIVVERLTDRERVSCEQILVRLGVAVETVQTYRNAAKAARRKARKVATVQPVEPSVLARLPLKPPSKQQAWRDR